MNTKIMSAPALVLLCLLPAPTLSAQLASSQKLAIIDMQSALTATKDGIRAVADLRTKFSPRNDALQKAQQDLQSKQDQYRRTQNTISEDAKAALERDIATLNRSFQRDTQDLKEEMDQSEQAMVSELGAKIMKVLSKYATDYHYSLIFDVSGQPGNILFASSAIDITREIIALYDKESPGDTSAPAPSANVSRPAVPSGAVHSRPGLPVTPAPAPK